MMPSDTIFGIRITVEPLLIGSKKAVQIGNGPIALSPAMYDLVSHAGSEQELRNLLGSIRVIHIPEIDFSLPLTIINKPSGYNYAAAFIDATRAVPPYRHSSPAHPGTLGDSDTGETR